LTKLQDIPLEGYPQMDVLKLLQMFGLYKHLFSRIGGVKNEMVTKLAMLLGFNLEELHLLILLFFLYVISNYSLDF
jgi:hypothetical protein